MGVRASCEKGGGRVCNGRSVGGFGGGEIGGTGAGSAIVGELIWGIVAVEILRIGSSTTRCCRGAFSDQGGSVQMFRNSGKAA